MAVTTQTNVASLMRRTLDRQTALARTKFRLDPKKVQNILLNFLNNKESGPYNELIKILKEWPLNDDNFRILFEDCTSCIVLLGRELKPFVEVVCNVEWLNRKSDLVELYVRFLLNLVTAHIYHLSVVLRSLFNQFKGDGDIWIDEPPQEATAYWSNVHTVIAQIVSIMPMTSNILIGIVIEQFPYYKAGCYSNRAYIHNMIWMSKYIPSLLEDIITAIISRMVEMDVNLVDNAKKAQSDTIFSMDIDDVECEITETLDYCMLELIKWLQDERNIAFSTMCTVFERVILPTYGIRHVQFLLLYIISVSQQCADRILNNLWAVAAGLHCLGPGAIATRRTAASHLAGLLARCVRVPNSRLLHYLRNMAEWCHSYITATQESTTASDNIKIHGAFYAICHAVFYLVAFKHQHLFRNKENIKFVESLNLPRLVTCNLNPLRSCPPQVTRAFSSVTRSHQVVYCQAIIEKNSRHSLQSNMYKEYDDWFPYDPYTLNRSGKVIWPLCIEYNDCSKDGEDETQYTSRMKKLDSDDDDYLNNSPSVKLASLSNCISPGFKS